MHQLHSLLDQQSRLVVNPIMGLYIAAPWTTSIPIVNRKWTELMQIREQLWNFLQEQIDVRSSSIFKLQRFCRFFKRTVIY